jgi:hypothetical protein
MSIASIRKITEADRTPDQNLIPAIRERAKSDVKKVLAYYGFLNIPKIAEHLGITYNLAKTLSTEVLTEAAQNQQEELQAQILHFDSFIERMTDAPESLTDRDVALMKLKMELFDKKNAIKRLRDGNISPKEADSLINFHIWGAIKQHNLDKLDKWQPSQEYEEQQEELSKK